MTGYDETNAICSYCKREMLVAHYGAHPPFSVLCPDCTIKAKQFTAKQQTVDISCQKENKHD